MRETEALAAGADADVPFFFSFFFGVPVESAPATRETPALYLLLSFFGVAVPVEPKPDTTEGRMPAAMETVALGSGPGGPGCQ